MVNFITKWFAKKNKEDDEFDEVKEPDPEELEFKTFSETYKLISFSLSIGMMYPNKRTTKPRFFIILFLIASIAPLTFMILLDMYRYYLAKDYVEIIRHSTIVGPFMGCFLKMLLALLQEKYAIDIIAEIDRDYSLYNRASPEFQDIVRQSIHNNLIYTERWWAVTVLTCVLTFPLMAVFQHIVRPSIHNNLVYTERWWAVTVLTCVLTFPLMAVTSTLYYQICNPEAVPSKFMIHEVNVPFYKDPNERLESPYYEIMFAYMMYCAGLYATNFLGYDGFYGLSINHACLKIHMYCKAIQEAMKLPTVEDVRKRVVWVIMEQNRTFEYMDNIQNFFNIWLGIIFLATMIQLCNLLYHISEGYGFDLRYMIFLSGVIVHIFLPCHYSAKLKFTCAETANQFYCCGWERVNDNDLGRMICFMIARAQIPHEITAFNMLTFDMELFVSILQTSYSMYTLLLS